MENFETVITKQMRDAIGVESDPVINDVEKGAIVKFAQAIEDGNPVFNNENIARQTRFGGLIAPPTFLRSMKVGKANPTVNSPYTANLDGGSEWEYFEPVRAGDQISVTQYLSDISERRGSLGHMLFMVRETKYTNQFGNVVALQRTTGISYNPSN